MQLSREMCTRLLQAYVGLVLDGRAISDGTKELLKELIIDTILTASCARSSGMEATTEASPLPSPPRPNSLSQSLRDFSQNILLRFHHIGNGTPVWQVNSGDLAILLRSLEGNGGSWEGVATLQLSVKQLHMTLRDPSPTS